MTTEEILQKAYQKSYIAKAKNKQRRFIWYKKALELLPDLEIKKGTCYHFHWFVWNLYNPNNTIVSKDGYNIHHKDEDTLNDDIKNLEKITHSRHSKHTNLNQSDEVRKKRSESAKGKRNNMYGKCGKLHPNYGKKNYKISEAKKKWWRLKKEKKLV